MFSYLREFFTCDKNCTSGSATDFINVSSFTDYTNGPVTDSNKGSVTDNNNRKINIVRFTSYVYGYLHGIELLVPQNFRVFEGNTILTAMRWKKAARQSL